MLSRPTTTKRTNASTSSVSRRRARTTMTRRRGATTETKAMDDEAKFVRDSRDEARERRLDTNTGRSMTDVETFVDALVSEEEEATL